MRYIVQKAPDVGGDPIPADEPCLVIRAQDMLAVQMMDHYLDLYAEQPGHDVGVVQEMLEHRENLIFWRDANPEKVKVADR